MRVVQLRLPWTTPSTAVARPRHVIELAGESQSVTVVRHRRARRYVIRLGSDGGIRLTVPRGASIAGGLAFAAAQSEWIARERGRQSDRARPWVSGTRIWIRGQQIAIEVADGAVSAGGEIIARVRPDDPVQAAVERSLRARATPELIARTEALAALHGLAVAKVAVRSQRSRWGTCSPSRAISLNWRLIQMPPSVCDYVILHELMHLRQPNHSARFWREVERVCPPWRDAERWLRRHGREL
jgi:predicted metal-dependent hydrolase